jgi:hypothetical protein
MRPNPLIPIFVAIEYIFSGRFLVDKFTTAPLVEAKFRNARTNTNLMPR